MHLANYIVYFAALLVGHIKCCTPSVCLSVHLSRASDLLKIGKL